MCKKLVCLTFIVLVMGTVLTSTANAADPSLVCWWSFDDGSGTTVFDSSGNGHHGEFVGSPEWADGMFAGALRFSLGNYVVVPGYKGVLGTNPRTCSAWIKTLTPDGVIVAWAPVISGSKWLMRVNQIGAGGELRCEVHDGYHYGTTRVNDDEWHHVAIVLEDDGSPDVSETKLYVDGVPDATGDVADEPINTLEAMDVTIGQNPHASNRWFDGLLDEVRIYEKALTEGEIQTVMEGAGEGFPLARGPNPPDGTILESTWINLSWKAGDFAVSHDVYIGDNFDDVNNGTLDTFRGNQTATYLIVGFPGFPYPEGLVPGTNYYWRIDEVNDANAASPWKGEVWSFLVPSREAYEPTPADGAKFLDPNMVLSWKAGFDAKLHHVYFGDNFDDVNNAVGALPLTDATYNPGTLEFEKTYYWRVDEFDGVVTHKGDVWSFTTMPVIAVTDDPNLVGWWKLDEGVGETALDRSGHGNHGTLFGPKWVVPGLIGNAALNLNGGYVAIQNLNYNSAGIRGVTVCAWIRTKSNAAQYIASFDRDQYWRLEINGNGGGPGQVGWDVMTSSGQVDSGSITRVDDGLWHHVCGTFDKGRMTIYIDGNPEPSVTGGPTFGSGNTRYGFIGANSEATDFNGSRGNGKPIFGEIDDFRIYDNALTAEEIKLAMRGDLTIAWDPSPANGSTQNIKDATPLIWSPGDKASQHDVYFGTDQGVVIDADSTDTTGIYRGRQSVASYTPPEGVEWGSGPYYWRIDEYNTDGSISKGTLWSFSVADYIGIDDFESYTDNDVAGEAIWQTWTDGYGIPTNGAQVGNLFPPYAEQTIVHSGLQSMPVIYNNTAGVTNSEVALPLIDTRDFTEEGVKVLSLWFRGYPPSFGSFTEGPAGIYTLTASGADIGGTADEFHFAYKMLTGAGSIIARVESVENTNSLAKAGVMIRETLDPNSKNAFACITPDSGVISQGRTDAGSASYSTTQSGIAAPRWVKLERDVAGNFTAYQSTNGSTWVMVENSTPQNILMNSNTYVGLAVTSHSAAVPCQARFSNVQITGIVGAQWIHQDIGITSNIAEPMYVDLSNNTGTSAVVYHDDPNTAVTNTWTEWTIDLQKFADQGLDLTNVDKIALGLGSKGNVPAPGGSGTMYFDDIRLYRPSP